MASPYGGQFNGKDQVIGSHQSNFLPYSPGSAAWLVQNFTCLDTRPSRTSCTHSADDRIFAVGSIHVVV